MMRIVFQEKIKTYESEDRVIVYLDESGFAQDMPRTHGYSLRGQRCQGLQNWQAKGRVNVIGAVVGMTFLTVGLFEGNVNGDVFQAWLTQALIPVLPQNAVIVMDNASFHKGDDIREAIEQAGASLEFLQPYSPDLNPIEKKWAQAKAIRRREHCQIEALFSDHFEYAKL